MLNDVPMEYFSALDNDGVRLDIANRPELNGGSVDYVAPKEYMVHCCSPQLPDEKACNWS